jgi:hypothetical protein
MLRSHPVVSLVEPATGPGSAWSWSSPSPSAGSPQLLGTTSTVNRALPFILVNDLRRRMVLRGRGGAPAVVLRRPRVRLRVIGRVVAAARARPWALGGSNALPSQCRAEGSPSLLSGRLRANAPRRPLN